MPRSKQSAYVYKATSHENESALFLIPGRLSQNARDMSRLGNGNNHFVPSDQHSKDCIVSVLTNISTREALSRTEGAMGKT